MLQNSSKQTIKCLVRQTQTSSTRPLVTATLLRTRNNRRQPLSTSRKESDLTHPSLLRDPPVTKPTDLWPLSQPKPPPTPDPLASTQTMEQILASPHPEGRDNEPTETLRKRLVYESRKRGILEMDLILATFAKERLALLEDWQLRQYDRFLTLPDWSIYYYVTDKSKCPEPWASSWVVNELLEHSRNKGRTVRRMPDLEEGNKA
ncbi:DUF339-domain-containing protein [Meredithblackwellia eburnea MCA 4105]